MNVKKYFLVAALAAGCSHGDGSNEVWVDKKPNANVAPERLYINEFRGKNAALPAGAKNVTHVGNGWVTFDLDVKGRVRTFLYARTLASGQYPVPAITELSE